MPWDLLARMLHLLALTVWLGHMFFWSIVVGPVTKRLEPEHVRRRVRDLSLRWGALGWPALIVLGVTGAFMLHNRGMTLDTLLSGEFLAGPTGRLLSVKLGLVACMAVYQALVGHHPAPRLAYLNMAAALLVIGVSVLLVKAPGLVMMSWAWR
jgi:uncharacterized membrane protein